jgi:PAS domain S-box-containing protein
MKRNITRSTIRTAKKSQRGKVGSALTRNAAIESEEIVMAVRRGKIGALVMSGNDGEQILTVEDAGYRLLVETINNGVATLDSRGTVLFANNQFAVIFRAEAENFIGTSLREHLSPEDWKIVQSLIADGLANSTQGEVNLEAADGRPRLVRLAVSPVRSSKLRNVSVVATELTELAEANEALKSNEESLRLLSARLLKLQDEERRHIARDLHDITGQKLAVLSMGLSQVLNRKSSELDADSRRTLAECSALSKQVGEEIRTLSYLLHPPLLDELGLPAAVKWYAEGYEQRTGIQVKVEIASDFARLPQDIEVALFRIIQESLTNVHRYSGSASAQVQVKVTAKKIDLKVSDFGKGIHRDVLNVNSGKVAPLGVGIQGMKERIRQLGGTLEITSKPNQGTQVTATLPIAHAEASPAPELSGTGTSPAHGQHTAAPERGRNAARKQILIADDHEMLRRGLRTMLEKEADWEICGEAVDGQAAVEKANLLRPDLVILDINMPVLNGLVAVRQISRNSPQTKILVFTVHESEATAKEICASGAHGYLSKNNASEHLLRVVRELLEDKISPATAVAIARNRPSL